MKSDGREHLPRSRHPLAGPEAKLPYEFIHSFIWIPIVMGMRQSTVDALKVRPRYSTLPNAIELEVSSPELLILCAANAEFVMANAFTP